MLLCALISSTRPSLSTQNLTSASSGSSRSVSMFLENWLVKKHSGGGGVIVNGPSGPEEEAEEVEKKDGVVGEDEEEEEDEFWMATLSWRPTRLA